MHVSSQNWSQPAFKTHCFSYMFAQTYVQKMHPLYLEACIAFLHEIVARLLSEAFLGTTAFLQHILCFRDKGAVRIATPSNSCCRVMKTNFEGHAFAYCGCQLRNSSHAFKHWLTSIRQLHVLKHFYKHLTGYFILVNWLLLDAGVLEFTFLLYAVCPVFFFSFFFFTLVQWNAMYYSQAQKFTGHRICRMLRHQASNSRVTVW